MTVGPDGGTPENDFTEDNMNDIDVIDPSDVDPNTLGVADDDSD